MNAMFIHFYIICFLASVGNFASGQVDWNSEQVKAVLNRFVTCGENMYDCGDRCIPASWFHDCHSDCSDGRDEECWPGLQKCDMCRCVNPADTGSLCVDGGLDTAKLCSVDQTELGVIFNCSNGNCVLMNWITDHTNDCGDWSDENTCLLGKNPCPKDSYCKFVPPGSPTCICNDPTKKVDAISATETACVPSPVTPFVPVVLIGYNITPYEDPPVPTRCAAASSPLDVAGVADQISFAVVLDVGSRDGMNLDKTVIEKSLGRYVIRAYIDEPTRFKNFYFAPFSDKALALTVTPSPLILRDDVTNLIPPKLSGGACNRPVYTSLYTVMKSMEPRSVVMLITDSSANDLATGEKRVISIALRKEIQVNIFFTAVDCHCICATTTNPEVFAAYKKLSTITHGIFAAIPARTQAAYDGAFRMTVDQMSSSSMLLYQSVTARATLSDQLVISGSIPVDSGIGQANVFGGGATQATDITLSTGDVYPIQTPLLEGADAKSTLLSYFIPEKTFDVRVQASRDPHLRIGAVGRFDVVVTFSPNPLTADPITTKTPLFGVATYVLIGLSVGSSATIVTENFSIDGIVVKEVMTDYRVYSASTASVRSLNASIAAYNWMAGPFYPPCDFFEVVVTGTNECGETFQRMSRTSFESREDKANRIPGGCNVNEFDCGDNTCIPTAQFRDCVPQCSTFVDEARPKDSQSCVKGFNACYGTDGNKGSGTFCDKPNVFVCPSDPSICVPQMYVNDGAADCPDGADEGIVVTTSTTVIGTTSSTTTASAQPTYQPTIVAPPTTIDLEQRIFSNSCPNEDAPSFQCTDNSCIPLTLFRDGPNHCPDGSDEVCPSNMTKCASERCGFPDEKDTQCKDRELADYCARVDMVKCKTGEFCTKADKLLNGVTDCPDGSDEDLKKRIFTNTCPKEGGPFFQCTDFTCIRLIDFRNNVNDCADGTDEVCPIGLVKCASGRCGLENEVATQCKDRELAQLCSDLQFWQCHDGEFCTAYQNLLDGVNNCPDGSDEGGQFTTTPNTGTTTSKVPIFEPTEVAPPTKIDLELSILNNSCPSAGAPYFQCTDGSCIPLVSFRDGTNNCNDGSDEVCLSPLVKCQSGRCADAAAANTDCSDKELEQLCSRAGMFKCKTGEFCTTVAKLLDGTTDCPDGSDEDLKRRLFSNNCSKTGGPYFECTDGECIPLTSFRNNVNDCADGTDEVCPADLVKCSSGRCGTADEVTTDCKDKQIDQLCTDLRFWRCKSGDFCTAHINLMDGVRDCPDGSDEGGQFTTTLAPTTTTNRVPVYNPTEVAPPSVIDLEKSILDNTCPVSDGPSFQCTDGSCIPLTSFRDGANNCNDGSDEVCPSPLVKCNSGRCAAASSANTDCRDQELETLCNRDGMFKCKTGEFCTRVSKLLNGVQNCPDGSDEDLQNRLFNNVCPKTGGPFFQCTDESCILLTKFRDNVNDCPDGTDEVCPVGFAKCASGRCGLPSEVATQCTDRQIEKLCTDLQFWQCKTDEFCTPHRNLMNGVTDCPDGSDEGLLTSTPASGTTTSTVPVYKPTEVAPPIDIDLAICVFNNDCPTNNGPYFQCVADLNCIPLTSFRDGVNNCIDGSDEVCPSGLVKCKSGRCAKESLSDTDCLDEQLKTFCNRDGMYKCKTGEFCTNVTKVLNGVRDCPDGSDEDLQSRIFANTCPKEGGPFFQCTDRKCILLTKFRDNVNDCSDGTDEVCPIGLVKCASGRCGLPNEVGTQCKDREISQLCTTLQYWPCKTGEFCTAQENLLDGVRNCPDGSDEGGDHISSTMLPLTTTVRVPVYNPTEVPPPAVIDLEKSIFENTCSTAGGPYFQCTDGSCIPLTYFRDGVNNCNDGADEVCPSGFVKCRTGRCATAALANSDCRDLELANLCNRGGMVKCQTGEFCTKLSKLLDGIKNCPDGSDENLEDRIFNNACPKEGGPYFECTDKTCISLLAFRDNNQDCADNTDEVCPYPLVKCESGRCGLPSENETQCSDRELIQLCSRSDMWQCKTGGYCTDVSRVLDGYNDCPDGSDEAGTSTTVAPKTTTVYTPPVYEPTDTPPPAEIDVETRIYNNSCSTAGGPYFQCTDGSCIPLTYFRNNEANCPDGSDEKCPPKLAKCVSGRCGLPSEINTDCSDRELIAICAQPLMWMCQTGEYCANTKQLMNGIRDCPDGSDEDPSYLDECYLGIARCPENAVCKNTPGGGFKCVCTFGYSGDGTYCVKPHRNRKN